MTVGTRLVKELHQCRIFFAGMTRRGAPHRLEGIAKVSKQVMCKVREMFVRNVEDDVAGTGESLSGDRIDLDLP